MRPAPGLLSVLVLGVFALAAPGHDIPNARVDRAIQLTIEPGRLRVDYEVSLAELTLTQELRALVGALPEGDRAAWFALYGRETGPLNAKGLLVTIDGEETALEEAGFDLQVEEHPRYQFHYAATIPAAGRLAFRDINFASSEGTSRLALAARSGVRLQGESWPERVDTLPIRPVWELSNEEERRTKQLETSYESPEVARPVEIAESPSRPTATVTAANRLSALLDDSAGPGILVLWLAALGLGAAHALQPGHGKTLVAAGSLGRGGDWWRGVALALIVTITHFASVLLIAAALWFSRSTEYDAWNRGLTNIAGFVIAAIGLWRLGRYLAGNPDPAGHTHRGEWDRGLLWVGIAGGIVPCWDAITLVVLAGAIGRLPLGLVLLSGFSLGMAAVLIAVGLAAGKLGGVLAGGKLSRVVGLAGSLVLTAIGLYLYAS